MGSNFYLSPQPFLYLFCFFSLDLVKLCKTVIECSKDAYPELSEKSEHIFATLNKEEESFNKTIDQGLSMLDTIDIWC